MNITIDDTSPNLVWTGGWKAQAPNQIAINDNYFLDTYHASQTQGDKATITFVGSAIYIYGSTGPNHGNYSVAFDNAIKFSPGFSTETLYRQLLFSYVFGTTFDTHDVVLENQENFWLDLDFMVLTINTTADTSTSDIGFFTSTVSPATSVPLPTSSGEGSDTTSASSSSIDPIFRTLTFILAAAIVVIVLLLVGLCVWRRRRNNPANRGWQADNKERDFRSDQEPEPLNITAAGERTGSRQTSFLGLTRQSRLFGQEPLPSPSTARSDGVQSPFTPPSFKSPSITSSSKATQGFGATRESLTVSNREDGLIALSNLGSRPKYRALPSDGYEARERSGTPNANRPIGAQHHRGVGASSSGSGSGGAVSAARERSDSDLQARFKGLAGRGREESVTNQSDTNISVLSSGATRIHQQVADVTPNSTGFAPRNLKKDDDNESVISGAGYANIGIGMYAQSNNHYAGSNADHLQRAADLKRSVSVASSGIVDRLGTSPPPVPELPLISPMGTDPSLYSQVQTANEGYGYNAATISGAAKVKHPYGKNNEMLIYGNKGPETGAQPLRPPPLKRASQTRLRSSSGSLSNMLAQSQSGSPEAQTQTQGQLQTPGSAAKNAENRYSRPPPSYSPSDHSSFLGMASQSSIGMPSQASSAMQSQVTIPQSGGTLQRSGTRTGDIPIGIEGFNSTDFEAESQESHSVVHAEVQMAKQINVNTMPIPSVAPLNLGKNPTAQYERSDLPYAKHPLAPPSQSIPYVNSHTSHTTATSHTLQEQRKGALAPTIGQFVGGPQVPTNRRARTPDSGRSYTPDRTMAIPGDRSYTPDRVPAADRYGVGRPSEDRVWTLEGVSQVGGQGRPSLERQRPPPPPPSLPLPTPLGAPIMDDRTRNAMTGSPAKNLPRRP